MSDAIAKHIEVVAALIVQDGRLLVCQRHETSEFPLKWEFPGGKVEPSEEREDALTREIKEELAIEIHDPVKIFNHRHFYPEAFEVNIDFFRVTRFSGNVRNRVFQQICWVPVGELTKFDFLEGDLPLVAILAGPEGERLLS